MPKGIYKQLRGKICQVCLTAYQSQRMSSQYCNGTCRNKVWRNNNREAYREKQRKWIQDNPEQHHINQYEYKKNQLKVDPLAKLRKNLRVRLYTALTRNQWVKKGKLKDYLGCSIEDLKKHLESKFWPNMTWDNYGDWHIDHIVPLASAIDEQGILKLCHYTNLQPLWAKDNLSKGDTL